MLELRSGHILGIWCHRVLQLCSWSSCFEHGRIKLRELPERSIHIGDRVERLYLLPRGHLPNKHWFDGLYGLCYRYILDNNRCVTFSELLELPRRHIGSVDRDGDVHGLRGRDVSGKHGVDELRHMSRRHVLSFWCERLLKLRRWQV